MTVDDELVSPLAKLRAVWNEEVSVTTPLDDMVISHDTVCHVGEEVALPIKICPDIGFMTETVDVP